MNINEEVYDNTFDNAWDSVAEEIYLAYDGKDLPEGIVKRARNY